MQVQPSPDDPFRFLSADVRRLYELFDDGKLKDNLPSCPERFVVLFRELSPTSSDSFQVILENVADASLLYVAKARAMSTESRMWSLFKTNKFLACCFALSHLENVLNAALMKIVSAGEERPKKLGDTLRHSSLPRILPPETIRTLLALTGPFVGLNLRNVLLHGFLWYVSERLAASTLCIAQQVMDDVLEPSRLLFIVPPSLCYDQRSLCICKSKLNHTVEDVERFVDVSLKGSLFIVDGTFDMWKTLMVSLLCHKQQEALLGIFALLEHSIRMVFCISNACQDRMMTACSDQLYTTLDILLAHFYQEPSMLEKGAVSQGQQINSPRKLNAIFSYLSCGKPNDPLVIALMDALFWSPGDGVRLRDVMAHGSFDYDHVDVSCDSLHICFMVAALCERFSSSPSHTAVALPCFEVLKHFRPVHHPLTLVLDAAEKASVFIESHFDGSCELVERFERSLPHVKHSEDYMNSPPPQMCILWQVWLRTAKMCCDFSLLLHEAKGKLESRARARANKRPALVFYEEHVSVLWSLVRLICSMCRTYHSTLDMEQSLCAWRVMGAMHGAGEKMEWTKVVHIAYCALGAPIVSDSHILSERELESLKL